MTGKTILITRAKGDEAELAETLLERGYRVIHEPMTDVILDHTARAALYEALMAEPDAVILTSRNGARALAALTELRDPMLVCVGDATADTARSLGFSRVCSAGRNAEHLAAYIADAYDEGSYFLHLSAQHIRTDLAGTLPQMDIERLVLYEAQPAPALSDTLMEQIRRGQLDAVTFLSQRTAEIFVRLIEAADLAGPVANLDAHALSDAVAEPLKRLPWQNISIAREPTLASLAECIDNAR